MITRLSVQDFLDQLAGRAPTPGGGSAAAIMGAMGAGLVSMVCNLTLGKAKYAAVEGDMLNLLEAAERARASLTALIAEDVVVFDQVMAAYGLPKGTDAEQQQRSAAIQSALQAATDVPLACARGCAEVMRLSGRAAEQGNLNVISDAGVAVMAAYAGLQSAALNVYINAGAIQDADFVARSVAEIERLVAEGERAVQSVYALVKSKL